MSRPDRVPILPLIVALTSWSASCGGPPSGGGASCGSDEECRPDARCSSSTCVENLPPIADFAIAGDLQANSVVTLDGSASHDPDRGDGIASYSWSIGSDGAPCDPPAVAATDSVVQVRFDCAGRFRVRLVVVDGKHAESTPAAQVLEVVPRSAPHIVEAGPDQAAGHLCSGTPLACRLGAAVQLTATTTAQAPVTFHWSVQPPPGRGLDAHRRVRFLPDASVQDPTVEIETDGTAISGDWLFRIEVKDGMGAVDSDVTRVSVANHAPAIRGGPSLPFAHVFDASNRRFTSGGTFPVEVTDEDGDPVVREVAFHHTGDGGAAFTGEDLGATIRFAVSVPYGASSDALFLRGGAGLVRSVVLTATDVNGTNSAAVFAVQIGDESPVMLKGAVAYLAADHTYDPNARAYLAQPAIGRWSDPDGDPLTYVVAADPDCPTFGVEDDGTVRVRCSSAFTPMGSLAELLGSRGATVVASDPWQSITSTVTFWIGDNPPALAASTYRPEVECRRDFCVTTVSKVVSVPLSITDPDGDPVEVMPSAGGHGAQCVPKQPCTMRVVVPELRSCLSTLPEVEIPIVATDGYAGTPGKIVISPVCR